MANKQLGRAAYRAFRMGNFTMLSAAGETEHLNDKTDFEQLPFKIWPPMYAFFVIHPDIELPATRQFVYNEVIAFPSGANTIQIQDADGSHSVRIEEVAASEDQIRAAMANGDDGNYCVFGLTGGGEVYFMAKCDAIVPAIYSKVFGPDNQAKCEDYIKEHRGDPKG